MRDLEDLRSTIASHDRLVRKVVENVCAHELADDLAAAAFEPHQLFEVSKERRELRRHRFEAVGLELGAVDHVLEVVCEEHQVAPEIGIVVLLEDRQQAGDEVRSVDDHFFPGPDQTEDGGVVAKVLESVERHEAEDERHVMQVTRQIVHLILRFDVAHELEANRHILHKLS